MEKPLSILQKMFTCSFVFKLLPFGVLFTFSIFNNLFAKERPLCKPSANHHYSRQNVTGTPNIMAGRATGAISACAGSASVSPNIEQFTVSATNLTANVIATAPTNFEISLSPVGGYGASVTIAALSGSVTNIIVYVRSSASAIAGAISGNISLSSNGALALSVAVSGFVSIVPAINTVQNQIVTSGSTTNAVSFTGTANTFTWVNNTPGIGLAASGTGNIAAFKAVNAGTTPVTAKITVTPINAGMAYITQLDATYTGSQDTMTVFNLFTDQVVAHLHDGESPLADAVSPDGSRVYVTNTIYNSLLVINTSTNSVIDSIPTAYGPNNLCISADGKTIYAPGENGALSIVDAGTGVMRASVNVGIGAFGCVLSPDGSRLYVATFDTPNNNLVVINTTADTVVTKIPIAVTDNVPDGVAITPDGSHVYIGMPSLGDIIVVNTATNSVSSTITGLSSPFGIVLSADGTKLFVANQSANNVSVINTSTDAVIATIPVGVMPSLLAFDRATGLLYVTNFASGTISAINTATNSVTATYNVGYHSHAISISPGNSGCTGTPYSFTITVNPSTTSSNSSLSQLTVTNGVLSPSFSSDTNSYTATVADSITTVILTPTTSNVGSTVTVNGTGVSSGAASAPISLGVGSNTIIVKVTAADGVTTTTYTIIITRAPSVITFAALPAKTYGDADFTPGATSTNSTVPITFTTDNSSVATIVNGDIHIVGAGNANITASQTTAQASVTQPLTVTPAMLTILADNKTMEYGGIVPALSVTFNGFVNGDSQATFTSPPRITTTGSSTSPVGIYPITASSAADPNYTINYLPGILTIGPDTLTVTATNETKSYGTDNPQLSLTYNGFLNGDTPATLISQATASTSATTNSPVGIYPIVPTGGAAGNYVFVYVNGMLTISPANRSITFNALPVKVYGNPDFNPGASASSGEAIIYTSDNPSVATIVNGNIHITGAGSANITATVDTNSNYSNTPFVTQQLVVNKAGQTISFPPIPIEFKGTQYDLSTVSASSGLPVAFTSADASIAIISGQTLTSVDLGAVLITASQPGDSNYYAAINVTQVDSVTDAARDYIIVHQTVSPNGDGKNDFLYIEGIESYPKNTVNILTRDGVLVYQQSDYNNASHVFDGHSNITGALQQAGTYFYKVEFDVNGVLMHKLGFIVLKYH